MIATVKRITSPIIAPGLLIFLSAITVLAWPHLAGKADEKEVLNALLILFPMVPYIIFGAGMIMGWRYNSAGLLLASLTVALAYFAVVHYPPESLTKPGQGISVSQATAFLLPLNMVACAWLTRRRLFTPAGIAATGVLLFQILGVLVVCDPVLATITKTAAQISPATGDKLAKFSTSLTGFFANDSRFPGENFSIPAQVAFCWAFLFMGLKMFFDSDPRLMGYMSSIVAAAFALAWDTNAAALAGRVPGSYTMFFLAAGLILLISSIEASFSMAYMDELTKLPGRRSLNETMLNLGKRYVIAMIDVDHFKKFNDTYGHKTGDQVLKMLAGKMTQISGGAKPFRYGGEEFTAIFPGKTKDEALPYIEKFREAVANTPFLVRGKDRKKSSPKSRGKVKTPPPKKVQVTISIGVAAPNHQLTTPELVIKAADKVLYKAKKAGRNRVMT